MVSGILCGQDMENFILSDKTPAPTHLEVSQRTCRIFLPPPKKTFDSCPCPSHHTQRKTDTTCDKSKRFTCQCMRFPLEVSMQQRCLPIHILTRWSPYLSLPWCHFQSCPPLYAASLGSVWISGSLALANTGLEQETTQDRRSRKHESNDEDSGCRHVRRQNNTSSEIREKASRQQTLMTHNLVTTTTTEVHSNEASKDSLHCIQIACHKQPLNICSTYGFNL